MHLAFLLISNMEDVLMSEFDCRCVWIAQTEHLLVALLTLPAHSSDWLVHLELHSVVSLVVLEHQAAWLVQTEHIPAVWLMHLNFVVELVEDLIAILSKKNQ